MPTLHEIEIALFRSVVRHDDGAAQDMIDARGVAAKHRLDVYRSTFVSVSANALRLSFPAIERLLGAEFFDCAARTFVENDPPRSACLNDYGAAFPRFLERYPPAASLVYLPGVARLEWVVSRALHAREAETLDVSGLLDVDPNDVDQVALVPHPSIGLVFAEHPVDEIWDAVLAQSDASMEAVDLGAGPVRLLVQRAATKIVVERLTEPEWSFMDALCAGRSLDEAIGLVPDVDAAAMLAEHLAAGRFIRIEHVDDGHRGVAGSQERPA